MQVIYYWICCYMFFISQLSNAAPDVILFTAISIVLHTQLYIRYLEYISLQLFVFHFFHLTFATCIISVLQISSSYRWDFKSFALSSNVQLNSCLLTFQIKMASTNSNYSVAYFLSLVYYTCGIVCSIFWIDLVTWNQFFHSFPLKCC